ncbi:MAG: glutathione S-transferase family protein [Steroidobacteraceae bacterium]
MGHLIEGRWTVTEPPAKRFVRAAAQFRNWVTADGSAGPSGTAGFRAEPGRYHLYVSRACPWSHRTLIFRALKGLEPLIGLSVTHWLVGEQGWTFEPGAGVVADSVNGARFLHEVYTRATPAYSGSATLAVLWDRERETIVSNESSEIIRMMNSAFDEVGAAAGDYNPRHLRAEVDELNDFIYTAVNDGVYKAGFAADQDEYEVAVAALFEAFDALESRLSSRRYLAGGQITEADWRLFTTLIRFDSVYVGHFKCNLRRLIDYPNLWAFARELYQWPGMRETCDFVHSKRHYYESHDWINPGRLVPLGPLLDFDSPHARDRSTALG